VVRNRIKRRLRAAVRLCAVAPGSDVVIGADASVAELEFGVLVAELAEALAAAGAGGPQ
jgi:ribonuclease P protein component